MDDFIKISLMMGFYLIREAHVFFFISNVLIFFTEYGYKGGKQGWWTPKFWRGSKGLLQKDSII